MLWRLPAPVRSFIVSNRRRYSSTKTADPLRVLFCGADEFSIASLRALNHVKHTDEQLVESIDVVHRPGKRTGRGLKTIREVPIKQVAAEELALTTHEIDTFTGWIPPIAYNIVIAVSFGLLVPRRILKAAAYGGLNVHPSLLPDLRGPAPIHHTLLKRRQTTGITIQTLHPEHFDHGIILAQTSPPGIDVAPAATPADLISSLGDMGGQMLIDVLKQRIFVPPVEEAGWYGTSGGPVDHAGKITPEDRLVDFSSMTGQDILMRHRVLGNLWCRVKLPLGDRLILNEVGPLHITISEGDHGLLVLGDLGLCARSADGQLLQIKSCTVAGGKKGQGNAQVMRSIAAHGR